MEMKNPFSEHRSLKTVYHGMINFEWKPYKFFATCASVDDDDDSTLELEKEIF